MATMSEVPQLLEKNNFCNSEDSLSVLKDVRNKKKKTHTVKRKKLSLKYKKTDKKTKNEITEDFDFCSKVKDEILSAEDDANFDILEKVSHLYGLSHVVSVNTLHDKVQGTSESEVLIKNEPADVKEDIIEDPESLSGGKSPQDFYFDVNARSKRKIKGAVKNFCCAHCDFTSLRWDRLKEHLIVHLEERPFSCDLCNFKAKTAKTLKRHKAVHSRERNYKCPLCSFAYKRKHTLKEHLMAHSKEHFFVCSVCDFSTTRAQYLKRHMLKHTQEKLTCHICGYETVYTSKLKRHVENHSGREKRVMHHCSKCDYKSLYSQCVRQHEKTHDKGTVYQCGLCEFVAGTSETLRIHMRMHMNGGNEYKCDCCQYETMRKRDIKRHYLNVHSIKKDIT